MLEGVALQQARVHECKGRSRVGFAMMVAAQITGHLFWIAPKWQRETLNPDGMRAFTKPQNFTFITPRQTRRYLIGDGREVAQWGSTSGGGTDDIPTKSEGGKAPTSGSRA